jgi:serine/threonine protein kinase
VNERDIFIAARHIASPADRHAYLAQACGSDAELRQRVEELLQAEDQAGSFLAGETQPFTLPEMESPISEAAGSIIGPYKLLQQIGAGGMGIVFMAEQSEPVRRRVALKIIKPGMNTREVIARFEAERQALALMDHPNIAKVLDVGTTDSGHPFFVMELVKGRPITEFCDEHHLTPRQRLELFIPVCQAIQHAHQKGLIHRDIKPSNILIAPYDGQPVVKVIDFGLAKATGQQLTSKTLFTQFGTLMGTLEYMSPEQAELNNRDIDTRSDIYSLGVLLYKLLTGSTPLDRERLKTVAFDELLRIVREDEPPKPSTRLSESHDTLPSISAQRQTEPAKLTKLVRGELDWIVMKALDKQRNRRYETANSLALDLQRYLEDEPVQACPPSVGYRFRKFARRNRGGIISAAALTVTLLAGAGVSLWQAIDATNARKLADSQRQLAESNLRKARDAVDQMLIRVADEKLARIPGVEPLRKQLLEDALKFYEQFLEQRGDEADLRFEVAQAWCRVGTIQDRLGQSANALIALENAARIVMELGRQRPNERQYFVLLAESSVKIGATNYMSGNYKDAEVALNQGLAACLHLQELFPQEPRHRFVGAQTQFWLATVFHATGRRAEAIVLLRSLIDFYRENIAASPNKRRDSMWWAYSLRHLSLLFSDKDDFEEADKLLAEAESVAEGLLGEPANDAPMWRFEEPELVFAVILLSRAELLEGRHRVDDQERIVRRGIEVLDPYFAACPNVATVAANWANLHTLLGRILAQTNRAHEAEQEYRKVLSMQKGRNSEIPRGESPAAEEGLNSILNQCGQGR